MQELPAHPHFECHWSLILRIYHDVPRSNEVQSLEGEVDAWTCAAGDPIYNMARGLI